MILSGSWPSLCRRDRGGSCHATLWPNSTAWRQNRTSSSQHAHTHTHAHTYAKHTHRDMHSTASVCKRHELELSESKKPPPHHITSHTESQSIDLKHKIITLSERTVQTTSHHIHHESRLRGLKYEFVSVLGKTHQ